MRSTGIGLPYGGRAHPIKRRGKSPPRSSRFASYATPSAVEFPRNAPRHCERSEAIQGEGFLRLDCFTNGKLPQVRNDNSPPVIASGAKQSRVRAFSVWIASPFGFAMTTPLVIASEAKQSRVRAFSVWIASPTANCCGFAMTILPRPCGRAPRHCERSEAIQGEGFLRLDCFTNGKLPQVRNDDSPSSLRASPSSLRAKRSNPGRTPRAIAFTFI
ncbi:MAG: hypothetical protein LBT00_06110 [Spirochaetaceae bacterium]|nr:hypothetical protein [Spirochaetaceae bacterium]